MQQVLLNKGLSQREVEVAVLVAKGLSNKEVAGLLFVTEKTVKFHLTNIYKTMKLHSRAQLIVWCIPHYSAAPTPAPVPVEPPKSVVKAAAKVASKPPVELPTGR